MSDPVGEDGLLKPPEPFKTPRWFTVTIVAAVVGAAVIFAVVFFWPR